MVKLINYNRLKGFLMVEKGIGEVCADGYNRSYKGGESQND